MMNKDLEKVGSLICEARCILDEVLTDTDWSEKEDQEDILLGILDNLQAAEGEFDDNKDEWIEQKGGAKAPSTFYMTVGTPPEPAISGGVPTVI